MRTNRLGAALAVVALSACATAARVEAPPAPPAPSAVGATRAATTCASLAQRLAPGMPLVAVNASLGDADAISQKICGNTAEASVAGCLHATYACVGEDGGRSELWVFFDADGAGAWKVRYFRAHRATRPGQGAI